MCRLLAALCIAELGLAIIFAIEAYRAWQSYAPDRTTADSAEEYVRAQQTRQNGAQAA